MQEIMIRQDTFERLQRHAKPLIDTPDAVIVRALDALERSRDLHAFNGHFSETERHMDPLSLPDLRHTKILEASIDGEPFARLKWNVLRNEMLRHAKRRVGSFEDLERLFPANLADGSKDDDGFHYLPDINISVQGQPANGACHAIVMAAQKLGISLNIGIMWRLRKDAAYPGERGRIVVPQSEDANAVGQGAFGQEDVVKQTKRKFSNLDRKPVIGLIQKHYSVKLDKVGSYDKWRRDQTGRTWWILGGIEGWHGIAEEMMEDEKQAQLEGKLVIALKKLSSIEVFVGSLSRLVSSSGKLSRNEDGAYLFNVKMQGGLMRCDRAPDVVLERIGSIPC